MHEIHPVWANENPRQRCNVLFPSSCCQAATEKLWDRHEANWSQRKERVLTRSQPQHPRTHKRNTVRKWSYITVRGHIDSLEYCERSLPGFISGQHWCRIRARITVVAVCDNSAEICLRSVSGQMYLWFPELQSAFLTQSHTEAKFYTLHPFMESFYFLAVFFIFTINSVVKMGTNIKISINVSLVFGWVCGYVRNTI